MLAQKEGEREGGRRTEKEAARRTHCVFRWACQHRAVEL